MKGRRVPVVVIQPASAQAADPSLLTDAAYFDAHPGLSEYVRDLIAGEAPMPLPPGTKVRVKLDRHGRRWRGFEPPRGGLN